LSRGRVRCPARKLAIDGEGRQTPQLRHRFSRQRGATRSKDDVIERRRIVRSRDLGGTEGAGMTDSEPVRILRVQVQPQLRQAPPGREPESLPASHKPRIAAKHQRLITSS
jgi:hypothetical protein